MKRKNLLITTVGDTYCIDSWFEEDRSYDIALIYYPERIEHETKEYIESKCDFLFYEQGYKYQIIQKILYNNSHLLDYNYFWMPDHDVLFRKGSVNNLFSFMESYKIELGQPSLVNKNRSWKILVNKRFFEIRYINLVEVMCPIFSKSSLDTCLESFTWSKSGWGLGLLWGKLIKNNIAVIDLLLVEHTRKMDVEGGALYKKLLDETGKTPEEERDFLVSKFNLDTFIRHRKMVPRNKGLVGKFLNWVC